MKIGIEARMMGPENTRGLGRYIQELVSAMARIAPEHEFVLVVRQADHPLAHLPNVRTVVADIPWYGWREQTEMPRILHGLKTDVVHIPHWNVPLFYEGPLVVTIHDLILRHQAASANASTRAWAVRAFKRLGYRLTMRHAIGSARRICVPTEFTKRDLEQLYPSAKGKTAVTGEGITRLAASNVECLTSNAGRGTPRLSSGQAPDVGRYLLYVGSAYPHKRLDLLLDAWEDFASGYPQLNLVLVGEADAFMRRVQADVEHRRLPRVTFMGRVSDAQLVDLYRQALAMVFPSSFEGFGLPPLEALSEGCPVVSSDAGPMPEVLGKKGVVYFKNGSKDGMLEAIKTVVDNRSLYHSQASEAGPELAARHSWEKAAVKTLETYRSAVLG